ncbi:MAG TPA: molybdopterin-dependent oxidoreductase [Streptosporangiaceae bacterium]
MASETDRPRPFIGALAGLLAGAVAVGVGQFVASLGAQNSSPVIAVGSSAIGLAPPAVKNFAISAFGSDDKIALLTGIYVLLGIYAAVVGVLGNRRLNYGLTGIAAFAAVGLAAAATRPGANAGYVIPTLIAAAASAITLILLLRNIPARPQPASTTEKTTSPKPTPPAGKKPSQPASKKPAQPAGQKPAPPGGDWWKPGASSPPRPSATRPVYPDQQRRAFLITGTAAAATAVAGGVAARVFAERGAVTHARADLRFPAPKLLLADRLPSGSDLQIPGLSSFITPNSSFYRVDTAIVLPQVPPENWTLRIHGMVEREIEISFDQLLHRPLIETYVTLCCVSNPVAGPYVGNARWLGASLADLIREARPRAGADQILSTSTDGYTSGTPVQTVLDGRDALLAVAMNGQPLPVEHGFPARMVVPGLYGYVSATKWVTDLKLTTFRAESSYWSQRGWLQQAPVKTESRIDVPNGTGPVKAGQTPVAGVAWAQHRGIEAVHVQVDNGPWQEATLATVPGLDTWRQWVWYWDASPGNHLIQARATDKTGYTQTRVQEPPEPNGASGYPQVQVTVQ